MVRVRVKRARLRVAGVSATLRLTATHTVRVSGLGSASLGANCSPPLGAAQLPHDPIFMPSVNLRVRDSLLGVLRTPVLGTAAIELTDRVPPLTADGARSKPPHAWVAARSPPANAVRSAAAREGRPSLFVIRSAEGDVGKFIAEQAVAKVPLDGREVAVDGFEFLTTDRTYEWVVSSSGGARWLAVLGRRLGLLG
eukprot:17702-Prymnesium_polylepis.1